MIGPRAVACGMALVVVLGLSSCNGGPALADVKGKVTLDGKPLTDGTMSFFPADGNAPTSGCEIKNGVYTARVPLGTMQVRINAPRVTGEKLLYADNPNGPKQQVKEESLPKRYHEETTLSLDVKPGVNEKNFELTSE